MTTEANRWIVFGLCGVERLISLPLMVDVGSIDVDVREGAEEGVVDDRRVDEHHAETIEAAPVDLSEHADLAGRPWARSDAGDLGPKPFVDDRRPARDRGLTRVDAVAAVPLIVLSMMVASSSSPVHTPTSLLSATTDEVTITSAIAVNAEVAVAGDDRAGDRDRSIGLEAVLREQGDGRATRIDGGLGVDPVVGERVAGHDEVPHRHIPAAIGMERVVVLARLGER